jgi:hypothetical protein
MRSWRQQREDRLRVRLVLNSASARARARARASGGPNNWNGVDNFVFLQMYRKVRTANREGRNAPVAVYNEII